MKTDMVLVLGCMMVQLGTLDGTFYNLLVVFLFFLHASIWEKAHRNCLAMDGSIKKKKCTFVYHIKCSFVWIIYCMFNQVATAQGLSIGFEGQAAMCCSV